MIAEDIERPAESRGVDPAKRRQIIDGASRVFLAQGFDAASMGAIAREAGVSKGTLYVYFKSKEELFEAIVEEQRRQQAEEIFTFDGEAAIEVELRRVGLGLARFLCRPGGVSPLRTVIAIADRMPEVGAKFYQSGPATGIVRLKTLPRRQSGKRDSQAARLRGGRRAVHGLVPVDDLQADAVQLRRSARGRAHRACGRHGRAHVPGGVSGGLRGRRGAMGSNPPSVQCPACRASQRV